MKQNRRIQTVVEKSLNNIKNVTEPKEKMILVRTMNVDLRARYANYQSNRFDQKRSANCLVPLLHDFKISQYEEEKIRQDVPF